MTGRLEGKVAIVSGAGSVGPGWGNGKATAVRFAREGAIVIAVDAKLEAAQETKAIIESESGPECMAVGTDVTVSAELKQMVDAVIGKFGRIDVLFNNVDIVKMGGSVDLSEEDVDKVLDGNLNSAFITCKNVIQHLIKTNKCAIVNNLSTDGIRYKRLSVRILLYVEGGFEPICGLDRTSVCAGRYSRKRDSSRVHGHAVRRGSDQEPQSGRFRDEASAQ